MLCGMFMHVHAGVVAVIIIVKYERYIFIIIMHHASCIMHNASCVWLVAIACAWDWDFGIGIRTTDIRMRTKPAPDPNQAGLGSEPKQTRIRVGVRGLLFTMIMLLGYCDWPVAACYTRHLNSNSSCSNMQLASCLDKSKKKTKGAC